MKTVYISDMTLRSAALSDMSFREKVETAKLLDRLAVDAIELCPIRDEKTDPILVKTIVSVLQNSRAVLPIGLDKAECDRAYACLKDAARPCPEIIAPVSVAQMEYLSHKKPPKMLEAIDRQVRYTVSLFGEAEVVFEDATRAENDFLQKAIDTAVAAGATAVTVQDTAGLLFPDEFYDFFSACKREGVRMGAECADDMSMGAANAFAAIRAGADTVKTCEYGRAALSVETFCNALTKRGASLDLSSGLVVTEIHRASEQLSLFVSHHKKNASPLENAFTVVSDGTELSESSTLTDVIRAVRSLGYSLSEDDHKTVYESFKRVAAKKPVTLKELDRIVAADALQVPPAYQVVRFVINSGNVIDATANIVLERDGRVLSGLSTGDGPIDAAFLGIEQILGHHYELDDFQIRSVTEGREAMGEALVKLRSGGKLFSGRGLSTDIIGASIRAYINALNKIIYEENA